MKILIVLPAYNAEQTIYKTFNDIPKKYKRNVLLVDDNSSDNTVEAARNLGIKVIKHKANKGYGGNQKTCYEKALKSNANIVIMIHPDYQYDARLVNLLVKPIEIGHLDIVYGNRIRTRKEALAGGMPKIKYLVNRIMSFGENIILGVNLGEHLSGMRAYHIDVLKKLPFQKFSNDFVFDQQFTISAAAFGFKIGDVPVPVRYYHESSSIGYYKGAIYLTETVIALLQYILFKLGIYRAGIFHYKKR